MSNHAKPEDLSRRILEASKEAGKSTLALSEATGIPSTTLHRNLVKTPQKLTLEQAMLLAVALDHDLEFVLVSRAAAA